MKLKAFHPSLTNIRSYLVSKANSGQKDLVVLNATNYSANDFIVIGNPGEENTEIRKISSISGNTITVTVNLGETHGQNIPVTVIEYDQVELWKSTTETGEYTKVVGSIKSLSIDEEYTELEDTAAASTDYFKLKYYNSQTDTYSGFSDSVGESGFNRYALAPLVDFGLALADDPQGKKITRAMIIEWINQWKDIVSTEVAEMNEKYFLRKRTYSLSNGTQEYDLTGKVLKINKVDTNLSGGDYYRSHWEDIEDDLPNANYDSTNPRHYFIDTQIGFRPIPTSDSAYARVWQVELPADLSNDGDELPDPLRYYLSNLEDYLEYKINKQKRKQGAADSAWRKFNDGKDTIVEQAGTRVENQNREIKVEEDEWETDY